MLPTLKGVFPQPKIKHKRDFLRENKLHVKDLQRNSSRQQLLQKAEEEQKLMELRMRQRNKQLDTRPFLSRRRPSTGCSCECGKTIVCCRPESAESQPRKVETCNREVQTEDIQDEEYLYQALKRCSSTDMTLEERAHGQVPEDNNHKLKSTQDNHYETSEHNFRFENLAIDTERLPPTANSTQMDSKRTTARRIHELGDRQDLRLPKYLEREKREKELQQQKELHRDRNCPFGYEALSEEQRLSALQTAQRKFQALINELNRMPMTTETLRVRSRKVEIEHELVELENDIRIFSKPKVYVKANGIF